MTRKPLEYSIFPWTESDFGQAGYLLSMREPYTGQRGQGFYLVRADAVRAYERAVDRYNRGGNPLEYLDAPSVQEPPAWRYTVQALYTVYDRGHHRYAWKHPSPPAVHRLGYSAGVFMGWTHTEAVAAVAEGNAHLGRV
jgi:hypothetical protein